MDKVAEDQDDVNDVGSDSDDSFVDDDSLSPEHEEEDELHIEAPLTDAEVEELVAELLEVESKAAEAQESLEKESLAKVESEVREELAEKYHGDDLEMAVASEMETFVEDWERTLDELETDSAQLLEQLDGSGVDLPALYKWIESKIPNGCSTEAWKKRAHWVGSQISSEVTESIENAEKYLQSQRPVRSKQGKLVEEGASGFLGKKLVEGKAKKSLIETEKDWSSFNEIIQSQRLSKDDNMFGGKHWASVYLASTPQQAADMGLKFPGVDEVEEIDDIDGSSGDPFIADAIANEKEIDLSEEQRKNFRKVKEEEDANITKRFQLHLKRRRQRVRSRQECTPQEADAVDGILEIENDSMPLNEVSIPGVCLGAPQNARDGIFSSNEIDQERPVANGIYPVLRNSAAADLAKNRGEKRSCDSHEMDFKRSRTDNLDTDDQMDVDDEKTKRDLKMQAEEEADDAESSPLTDSEPNVSESSENFQCTICTKVVRACDVRQHPILKVIVCGNCKSVVDEKMQEKDPDCSLCYCGWCGRSNDLLSCKSCKILFCSTCIMCNLGESSLSNCRTSGWHCFCCSPSLLERLTGECVKALAFTDLSMASSDSDSEASGAGTNGRIRTRKRRKKKIRRIIDDAELGEETKQKIAIEKARQEHLQSLQEQYAGGSKTTISSSCSGSTLEGASAEVLGDATKGYIVNVVREKEEEAVRIPASISAKLKPHQIAGIRFMWENIIQCIQKVKSGDRGLGCILAHNMGLGKTFQVITFLYTAMRCVDLGLKSALIVTPVNVLHNWRHEFMKWKPMEQKALRIYMLDDVSREKRLDLLKKWKVKGGVFLIGYTNFRNLSLGKYVKDKHISQEFCTVLQDGPDILVCDEAHMIKNTKADVTQALKQVKCQRRIALTGSPLQNNLMEYYCMVDFVREGFLGSSHEFRNRFQNPIENGQHANSTSNDVRVMNHRSHILYQQLKGFVQRMDMNVVKMDLPPKTVYVIAVKLSPLQRKLYRGFLDEHGFTKGKVSGEKNEVKRCFFAGYQALAQIWNHPAVLQLAKEQKDKQRREDAVENFLVDDISSDDNMEPQNEKQEAKIDLTKKIDNNLFLHKDWWKNLLKEETYKEADYGGKMVLLLDILTMSSAVGDKVLVFSQSLLTLDLIERYLSKLPRHGNPGKFWKEGKDWYRLDGSTAGSERQKLVEKFNESTNTRVKCTLISTKAGSLGINLHAANRVIIVDGSWNPTHDLQAIYRVWRYGQVKPVFAYRLMAHGTMEEKIYKRQVTKEGLAARVVDKQQVYRTMSKEEMLHLFDFGDDDNLDATLPEFEQPRAGSLFSQKLSLETSSSDKVMESLLNNHHPRWIVNYHEHETLLQENEEEKLTKEEQDIVWENYQKGQWEEVTKVVTPQTEEAGKVVTSGVIQWEEVHHVYDDSDELQIISKEEATAGGYEAVVYEQPRQVILALAAAGAPLPRVASHSTKPSPSSFKSDNNTVQRKCTNLSHMLTLRSQGTKAGCTTVCGECAQEISWESLSRNVKPPGR
ncbi:DNA helicase [Ranunculus cassubicifolius]